MIRKIPNPSLFLLGLLFILITGRELYNLFIHLNDTQLFDWDESRHGVSALEMIESGNLLINTYNKAPDYWYLKPSLGYLPMIAGMKIFGASVFGLRIISVAASFITFILVSHIGYRVRGGALAIIAAAIFSCWPVYMLFHGARSGDPDAIYILWYVIAIALLIREKAIKPNSYLIAGILCSLAFLTKSFHVLTLGVTLSIFVFMDFSAISDRVKAMSFLAVGSFLPALVWVALRWNYDQSAFLGRMIGTDIIQRSSEAMEGHNGSWYFYFEYLWHESKYWLMTAGAAFIAGLTSQRNKDSLHPSLNIKKILVAAAVPIILFTAAKTKLTWYVSPSLPFLSLALALLLIETSERTNRKKQLISSALKISVAATYIYYQFVIQCSQDKRQHGFKLMNLWLFGLARRGLDRSSWWV